MQASLDIGSCGADPNEVKCWLGGACSRHKDVTCCPTRVDQLPHPWLLYPFTSNTGVLAVKYPKALLKVAALVSSVLLAGGCISYHAGAFNRLLAPGSRAEKTAASEQPPPDSAQPAPAIMSGSKSFMPSGLKSIEGLTPEGTSPTSTAQQSPPETTQPTPTIMGGSKSSYPLRITAPLP